MGISETQFRYFWENRSRLTRFKAHKQQHWLTHKLIQQINGFEEEIYVSTDGTLPYNGHSRDGNDSKEAIGTLHHVWVSEHQI